MSTRAQCNETSRNVWGFATMEDFHKAVTKAFSTWPSVIFQHGDCKTLYLTKDQAAEIGITKFGKKPEGSGKCPCCGGEFSF